MADVQYRLGGGKWKSRSWVRVTRQGVTRVQYPAVDALGLTSPVRRCRVRIDSRRPHVVARSASGRAGSAVRLRYRVADASPGCGTALVRLVVTDAAGRILTGALQSARPRPTRGTPSPSRRAVWRLVSARVALRAVDRAGNFQRGLTAVRLTVG